VTVRDPARYPRSHAYVTDPQARPVPGAPLLPGYTHLHAIEQLVADPALGVNDAFERCWRLYYYDGLRRACGEEFGALFPEAGDWKTLGGIPFHEPRWRRNCLAQAAAATAEALRMPWQPDANPGHTRIVQQLHADAPTAEAYIMSTATTHLHPTDLRHVLWLEEAVRRIAQGTELDDALRGAYDQAQGRPRRHRAPLDQAWLTEVLGHTLTAIWWALLWARNGYGLPWMQASYADRFGEDTRPAASTMVMDGR
jgi:hypothetical protein